MQVWPVGTLVLGLGGCLEASQGSFTCSTDAQCRAAGVQGTCEAVGWCSFPDPACASRSRFGGLAGGGLAGQCVGATNDGGVDAPMMVDAPSCGGALQECCAGGSCSQPLVCQTGTCTYPPLAHMPTVRAGLGVVAGTDGRLYAMGGFQQFGPVPDPVTAVEAYDPHTNTWSDRAPMPGPRHYFAAVLVSSGRIVAIGGNDGSASNGFVRWVDSYDPASNLWSPRAGMPTAREALAAATGIDDHIYAAGGHNNSNLATVEAYDPATDSWSARASMPAPRFGLAAVASSDGREIYVIGGASWTNTLEVYVLATDIWSPRASMPTARSFVAAAAGTDGRIYAVGGFDGSNTLATVEVYDPASDRWSARSSMPTARHSLGVALGVDGRIYAIGGSNGPVPVPNNSFVLDTVEAYDPIGDAWYR